MRGWKRIRNQLRGMSGGRRTSMVQCHWTEEGREASGRKRLSGIFSIKPVCRRKNWSFRAALSNRNMWELQRSVLSFLMSKFFFPVIFISWRLITIQHCSGFCHTLTWISYGFTCVPHPDPPCCLPPHLTWWANFLKVEIGEINLNNIFYITQYSWIILFQHVINVKTFLSVFPSR